jgi:hypothetical protein
VNSTVLIPAAAAVDAPLFLTGAGVPGAGASAGKSPGGTTAGSVGAAVGSASVSTRFTVKLS